MNRAQMALAVASSPLRQHASPRESSPSPPPRPTAMPAPERPAPKSTRATRLGSAIKAAPVTASIAADSVTSILVVICYSKPTDRTITRSALCSHLLRPLLEHLLHGLFHHLLVLVAIVVQGILCDTTPYQRLRLRIIEINDHGCFHVLFGTDSSHSPADAAHTPRAIGGLLFHTTVRGEDQVGILVLLHHLQAFTLHCGVDCPVALLAPGSSFGSGWRC